MNTDKAYLLGLVIVGTRKRKLDDKKVQSIADSFTSLWR